MHTACEEVTRIGKLCVSSKESLAGQSHMLNRFHDESEVPYGTAGDTGRNITLLAVCHVLALKDSSSV